MKHYTRLLEQRIDWTQPSRRRDKADADEDEDGEDVAEGAVETTKTGDAATEETSLADNRCDVLWHGSITEHTFHTFKSVKAPTDNLAREQLGAKLSNFWDSVKNWKPSDDELLMGD